MNNTQREFEAYAADKHGANRIGKDFDGEYGSDSVREDWLTWQAATTAHEEKVRELVEAVNEFFNVPTEHKGGAGYKEDLDKLEIAEAKVKLALAEYEKGK